MSVRIETEDAAALLTLDRPPLNILDIATIEELSRAVARVRTLDPAALVLRGEGRAFSAGADVSEHLPDKVERMLASFHALANDLVDFPGIVIASVRGAALGGGCELALTADLVFAADDASFGQPEIKLGVFPPVAMVLLPRLCGPKNAAEMILTGEAVSAQDALQMGLVNRVFPAADLDAETRAAVNRLSKLSRSSLRLAKETLRKLHPADFKGELARAERIYLEELMATPDAVEGCRAFLEKRRPTWTVRGPGPRTK